MLPWGAGDSEAEPLALHRLRLSATRLRLQGCAPIGLGLGLGPPAADQAQAGLQPSLGQPRPAPGQPPASLGQLAADIFWLGGHTDLVPHIGAASRARKTSAPRCLSASRSTACASRSGVRSPTGCDWLFRRPPMAPAAFCVRHPKRATFRITWLTPPSCAEARIPTREGRHLDGSRRNGEPGGALQPPMAPRQWGALRQSLT